MDEFRGEVRIVVNFSVEDNQNGLVFIEDRLLPSTEVDDAEPTVPEACVALHEVAVVVWPTVNQNRVHTLNKIAIHGLGSVEINDAANSTHSFVLDAEDLCEVAVGLA